VEGCAALFQGAGKPRHKRCLRGHGRPGRPRSPGPSRTQFRVGGKGCHGVFRGWGRRRPVSQARRSGARSRACASGVAWRRSPDGTALDVPPAVALRARHLTPQKPTGENAMRQNPPARQPPGGQLACLKSARASRTADEASPTHQSSPRGEAVRFERLHRLPRDQPSDRGPVERGKSVCDGRILGRQRLLPRAPAVTEIGWATGSSGDVGAGQGGRAIEATQNNPYGGPGGRGVRVGACSSSPATPPSRRR